MSREETVKEVQKSKRAEGEDAPYMGKKGATTKTTTGSSSKFKHISKWLRRQIYSAECRGFRPEELIKYKKVLAAEAESRKLYEVEYAKRPVAEA